MIQVPSTHPRSLTCATCGDVIGVYEPAVVVEHGAPRHTSLAAEPAARPRPEVSTWHHGSCFATAGSAAAAPAVA